MLRSPENYGYMRANKQIPDVPFRANFQQTPGIFWCLSVLVIAFVWALGISIIYFYGYSDILSSKKSLDNSLKGLDKLLLIEYKNCCEELPIPENCTCQGTSISPRCWNANTNTPILQTGIPPEEENILYVVCEPGTTLLNGISDWEEGDYVWFSEISDTWVRNEAGGSSPIQRQSAELELFKFDPDETPNPEFIQNITVDLYTFFDTWKILYSPGFKTSLSPTPHFATSELPPDFQFNTTNRFLQSYRIYSGADSYPYEGNGIENVLRAFNRLVTIDLSNRLRFARIVDGAGLVNFKDDSGDCTVNSSVTIPAFFIFYDQNPIEIEFPDAIRFEPILPSPFSTLSSFEWGEQFPVGQDACIPDF